MEVQISLYKLCAMFAMMYYSIPQEIPIEIIEKNYHIVQNLDQNFKLNDNILQAGFS